MINNRQTGRRRGRGGQRPQNGQGRPEQGNRIDNRARGNAAQLHEKYKTLARDMQTQGDRVMAEYYLQFADHYFRVLSESRARFEEHNAQRRQRDDAQDFDDDADEARAEGEDAERNEDDFRQPRRDRNRDQNRDQYRNRDRQPRADREAGGEGNVAPHAEAAESSEESAADQSGERAERRPRRGRRAEAAAQDSGDANGIDADRLPPAFALTSETPEPVAEEAPKPRRGRPRKAAPAEVPVEG